jgi:sterol 3beta-glucosyltransferase
MRVTILTYGSRGDVQPCLALARALQQAGHAPLLALPANLRREADTLGIPAVSLPGDIVGLSRGLPRPGKTRSGWCA